MNGTSTAGPADDRGGDGRGQRAAAARWLSLIVGTVVLLWTMAKLERELRKRSLRVLNGIPAGGAGSGGGGGDLSEAAGGHRS